MSDPLLTLMCEGVGQMTVAFVTLLLHRRRCLPCPRKQRQQQGSLSQRMHLKDAFWVTRLPLALLSLPCPSLDYLSLVCCCDATAGQEFRLPLRWTLTASAAFPDAHSDDGHTDSRKQDGRGNDVLKTYMWIDEHLGKNIRTGSTAAAVVRRLSCNESRRH